MRSVTNLAANLSHAAIFKRVAVDDGSASIDLSVVVRKSYGVLRCGTSLPLTKATLGLMRDRIAYTYVYDFDFVSPRTGRSFSFQASYQGTYRSGFWPPKSDGFVELLRFDLLQRRPEIENSILEKKDSTSH